MGQSTGIQWTHHTWNMVWGCTKVSEACKFCYAESWARRYGVGWGPDAPRRTFGAKHWAEPLAWDRAAAKAGERRRVFCSSMADVFEDHPTVDAERSKLWPLIRATPHLDWLLLTKRPERIAPHLPEDWGVGWPNVWLGTTVENQQWADERIPHLLKIPATVRFLSCEPVLGPINLSTWIGDRQEDTVRRRLAGLSYYRSFIHWAIIGGESGPDSRPMDLAWVRSLIRQCETAGVACFVKQIGSVWARQDRRFQRSARETILNSGTPEWAGPLVEPDSKGGEPSHWPEDLRVRQFPVVATV